MKHVKLGLTVLGIGLALLAWGLSMTVIGALICWMLF